MVQQLALYGTVADEKRDLLLHALGAVSGIAAEQFETVVLVWEPAHKYQPKLAPGKVNQIEQYRIFARSDSANVPAYSDAALPALLDYAWEFEIHEVPEPGKNFKVLSQQILRTRVESGDPFQTLRSLGYNYSSQYWISGHRCVIKNIIVQVFQLYAPADGGERALVDDSWTMKACVDVKNVADLAAIEMGAAELEGFQQDLRGLVTLEIPAKGLFDTRIR